MGDFVNGNTKSQQMSLINTNRILHSGLDFYIEEHPEVEIINESLIKDWDSKLNCKVGIAHPTT